MRISELSEQTGVSIATLKFYLREGLLHSGEATSATRARYDATHVARVRLVRALIDGGGLSIAKARAVVDALEHPPESRHDLLGVAHRVIPYAGQDHEVSGEVRALIEALGWQVEPDAPALRMLSAAVDTARAAGLPVREEALAAYARGCLAVAEVDVSAAVGTRSPEEALATVVLGTLLIDPVLVALRRAAQEHLSGARARASRT